MHKRIEKLYPSTKFMIVLTVVIISMFAKLPTTQYVLFAVAVGLTLISGTIKNFFKTFFKSIFVIVVFIFLVQVFNCEI